jgi:superfamily I DNA/RNA helicase
VETTSGHVSISTIASGKGLEFRARGGHGVRRRGVPLQERIETAGEESELEEVYNTERHLLYVACTRARHHLLATSVRPASEFLDDLRGRDRHVQAWLPDSCSDCAMCTTGVVRVMIRTQKTRVNRR